MKRKPKTIGYLRVSTIDQDNEKFEADIRAFANKADLGRVEFIAEKVSGRKDWKTRKIFSVLRDLQDGDKIIVPELSRLGRSTLDCLTILKEAKDRGISVYSIKEGIQLNGDGIQSQVMATVLSLVAQLESTFISLRTKEGLRQAKAKGVKLGRPKGSIGPSKLDPHRDEIIALLNNGSTKTFVAAKYGTSVPNLHGWIRKHKLTKKVRPEIRSA